MFGFKKRALHARVSACRRRVRRYRDAKGTIKVKFDGEGAPIHVANFCELPRWASMMALSSIAMCPVCHPGRRPNTRDMSGADVAAGLEGPDGMPGTGGPGYCIKGEFATNPRNSHVDGALAMARSMDPDSAGSQFYFCLAPSITSIPVTPSLVPRSRVSM